MSVNKVILIGNAGQDPKVTKFDNGGMTAQFSIATTKKAFKAKDGTEIPERTEWHKLVLQNGLAKVAEQYIKKGDRVYIEGELRTRKYTDSNNIEREITEVFATSLELLGEKKAAGAPAPQPEYTGDDLPF